MRGKEELKLFSSLKPWSVLAYMEFLLPCRESAGIRSLRCAIDAANLWKNHHDALPSMTEPVSREDRDYRWRLSISRRDWIKLAGRLAETVQYDNFKSAVHRNPSQGSKSACYLRIWSTMADLQRSETHGDVVKRHQPDDAAWQSFVAKVDKPVTTGQTQSGEEVSQTGEEALAIVSTPKFSFVRVKIHDLIDDERGGRRSSGGTLIDLRGRPSDSGSINGVSI